VPRDGLPGSYSYGVITVRTMELLVSIPLLVVVCSFVDISLTVLQHPIDESGEPMGHGRYGLRGSKFGAQTTVLGAQGRSGSMAVSTIDPPRRQII
jgi:hypothetical protein